MNCLNGLVQYAMNAGREIDEKLNFSVLAETMILLANSPYGYRLMYQSQHTVTKYLGDGKRHGTIENKVPKGLFYNNDQLLKK